MNMQWGGKHSRNKRRGGIGGVARAIKPRGRLLVGLVPGRGEMIATEGGIERDFVYLALFDPAVKRIVSQPEAIYYCYWPASDPVRVQLLDKDDRRVPAGAVHCGQPHYPDFLVYREDARPLLVEVKTEREINSPDVRRKAVAGQAYGRLVGYDYRIVTDRVLRSGFLLANVKEIRRHADYSVPVSHRLQIHDLLVSAGGTLPYGVLVELLCSAWADRSQAIKAVYRLLWDHELAGDLANRPINSEFVLSLTKEFQP